MTSTVLIPRSMQDACYIWTQSNDLALREVSQLSGYSAHPVIAGKVMGSVLSSIQIFALSHARVMLISSLSTFQYYFPLDFVK